MNISRKELINLENLMFSRARDIDVAMFNCLLDEACKDFVLDCLMLYMNKDGGIGNALHIDNYNPNSSVYQTYECLRFLDELDFSSSTENPLFTQLTNKIGNYLFNKVKLENGMWNPVVPSNNDFAHSSEFNYYPNALDTWQYMPTAAIVGYCLVIFNPNNPYYKKAYRMLDSISDYVLKKETLTKYDFIAYNSLVGSLKKCNLIPVKAKEIETKLVSQALLKLDDKSYCFARLLSNCEVDGILKARIDSELDEIINNKASHGLWEHKGGWGTNEYPEADSASIKWIGAETVDVLFLLKKYGRVEK